MTRYFFAIFRQDKSFTTQIIYERTLVTDELNIGVYVEKRVMVPAHITSLNVRIESAAWENRVGNVWFDNVSIHGVNDSAAIEIIEESNYYPFGLQHKGYDNVVNGVSQIRMIMTPDGLALADRLRFLPD